MWQQYIRQRRKVLIAGGLFFLVFLAVFWLYDLPLAPFWYGLGLCALAGVVFLWVDFLQVRQRHQRLRELAGLPAALIEDFPAAQDVESRDYQEIIRLLCAQQRQWEDQMAVRYGDMVEYYTVWAHQIKTPIAAMALSLQGEDTPLSHRLTVELNRIEQYVEMVMAFVRLDGDATDYVFRECRLDDLIRSAVKKFSGEFINRRLTLTYHPTEKTLVSDEKWLSFVLEQLLSNALKYTAEGGITIRVTEEELLVEDTGMGIAPEDLPRVFDKGYTGVRGRADRRASGIGLYLCRRVCDRLGLGIAVESVLGEGTRVHLDLHQKKVTKE